MDNLAPGVPVAAKVLLLLGMAGGLFATIVLSYAASRWQYLGVGIGIGFGILGAAVVTLRARRSNPPAG